MDSLAVAESWVSAEKIPDTRETQPEPLTVFYDVGRKDYWIENSRADWITVNETSLRRHLKDRGFSAKPHDGEPLSPLDRHLTQIQRESDVAYAGPLAGYNKGILEVCGQRILVTTSPKLIVPQPGEFPVFQQLVNHLFQGEQLDYVKGWLKIAYESLRDEHIRPGQVLVLAGERNSGKSLFQNIITEILGGRVAKPYRYMSGGTDFNGDLFGAEHLTIEDEVASTDIRARRNFGARIKDFTVNVVQSCHAKNRQAINLTPFWRVSVSVNEEPENLSVLPPFDDSVGDKIILLRVFKKELPMPTLSQEERKKFWQTLIAELPAFLWDLTHWEIPRSLECHRFGIKHFHHPELLETLEEIAPEIKLLSLIDLAFKHGTLQESPFEGTAEELAVALFANPAIEYEAKRLLSWTGATGTYLGRLARKASPRIFDVRTASQRLWRIIPPPRDDAVTPCLDFCPPPLTHGASRFDTSMTP